MSNVEQQTPDSSAENSISGSQAGTKLSTISETDEKDGEDEDNTVKRPHLSSASKQINDSRPGETRYSDVTHNEARAKSGTDRNDPLQEINNLGNLTQRDPSDDPSKYLPFIARQC